MTFVSSAVRPSLRGRIAVPIASIKFPSHVTHPNVVMHCEVVFGSPSMNCNGTGICKITGTNSVLSMHLKKDCQLTFGQIAAAPNGKVSLFFFREYLCINLYKKHFRKGILEMKEQCPLPADLSKALNIQGNMLLPGLYTVVETEDYFRVDVDCA
jgi:hypothetical protein